MKLLQSLLDEMPQPAQREKLMNTEWQSYEDIQEYLDDNGFSHVGKGYFSNVYGKKGSDKVIKFSRRVDPCYMNFVKFVKENPSKYFPKIYDYVEYKAQNGKKLFVTVIERLQPISFNQIKWNKDNIAFLAWLLDEGTLQLDDDQFKQALNLMKIPQEGRSSGFSHLSSEDIITNKARLFMSSRHKGAMLYRQLADTLKPDCIEDLHDGNIFYRPSDNTIVFLDPFA